MRAETSHIVLFSKSDVWYYFDFVNQYIFFSTLVARNNYCRQEDGK